MKLRMLLVLGGLTVLAMMGAPAAWAASSVESGWWSAAAPLSGPDVSDEQLLVQGGPDASHPLAYAGISFTLDSGEAPQTLVLTVAPSSASTPGSNLTLCPLDEPASAAAGEPAAEGPSFDCTMKVDAKPSADGASYEFDLAGFTASGSLDVAVLPKLPTDRVVLVRPTTAALQEGSGDADGVTTSGGFSGGSSSSGGSTSSGAAPAAGPIEAPSSPAGAELPALEDAAAPAAPTEPGAASEPAGGEVASDVPAVPAAAGDDASSRAGLAFVGLAAAAAVLWAVAGQHDAPQLAGASVADEGETR